MWAYIRSRSQIDLATEEAPKWTNKILLYFSLRPDQINLLVLLKHVAQLLFYIYFFRSVGRSIFKKKKSEQQH